MVKRVRFTEIDIIYETYSSLPADTWFYDRSQIDHLLYRRAYKKISEMDYMKELYYLELYKKNEMVVCRV